MLWKARQTEQAGPDERTDRNKNMQQAGREYPREGSIMYIGINGIQLYYEKTGHGRPLILVHGNSEDHTIFDEAVGVLKEYYTCYTPDSRGHGQSTPCRELHYRDMAQDMVAFMTELDLNDVAFYGFSDGGIVGLLAAMGCGRITNLIVSGANITTKGCKVWFRLFIKAVGTVRKDPLFELMEKEPNIPPEQLASIKVPTLVIAGSRDLIREDETKLIAKSIPNAKLMILEGEGHGTYIVHKTKIAEILVKELAR